MWLLPKTSRVTWLTDRLSHLNPSFRIRLDRLSGMLDFRGLALSVSEYCVLGHKSPNGQTEMGSRRFTGLIQKTKINACDRATLIDPLTKQIPNYSLIYSSQFFPLS